MTFDGSGWFDFMGTCTYYLARTKTIKENDSRWFTVEAKNEHRNGNTRVSYLSYLTVRLFDDEEVVVTLEKNNVVKVILVI